MIWQWNLGVSPSSWNEEKAKRNGYNVDDLYDCVGDAEQMGNVRIGLGTWQAKSREVQFGAQCPVSSPFLNSLGSCRTLSCRRTYEDMNEPEGEDSPTDNRGYRAGTRLRLGTGKGNTDTMASYTLDVF